MLDSSHPLGQRSALDAIQGTNVIQQLTLKLTWKQTSALACNVSPMQCMSGLHARLATTVMKVSLNRYPALLELTRKLVFPKLLSLLVSQ